MPITPNDVIINIHHYINNPFNGFEATFNKCADHLKKLFIETCFNIVLHGWNEQTKLSDVIEDNEVLNDFFELLKDIYFSPLQTIIINRNDVYAADIPSIQLFVRMSLLKHINDISFQSEEILQSRQQLVREYEQYPKSKIQFFNKKPIDLVKTNIKRERVDKRLRTIIGVTVWFLLLQLLIYTVHDCFSANAPCKGKKNSIYIFNSVGLLGVAALLLQDFIKFLELSKIKNYFESGVISPELDPVKDKLLTPTRTFGNR